MYKVFINEKSLVFTEKGNVDNFPNTLFLNPFKGTSNIDNYMQYFENLEGNHFIYPTNNLEEDWLKFRNSFLIISAAGGIVFNEENKMLFIFRLGKWDLPKGKIEANESIADAAVREVQEECGLKNISIGDKTCVSYHIYNAFGSTVLKPTHWYKMFASKNETLVPQLEENITKIEWIDRGDLAIVFENTYQNIIDVLKTTS